MLAKNDKLFKTMKRKYEDLCGVSRVYSLDAKFRYDLCDGEYISSFFSERELDYDEIILAMIYCDAENVFHCCYKGPNNSICCVGVRSRDPIKSLQYPAHLWYISGYDVKNIYTSKTYLTDDDFCDPDDEVEVANVLIGKGDIDDLILILKDIDESVCDAYNDIVLCDDEDEE